MARIPLSGMILFCILVHWNSDPHPCLHCSARILILQDIVFHEEYILFSIHQIPKEFIFSFSFGFRYYFIHIFHVFSNYLLVFKDVSFIHRITSARAEGINSKIALIEKMAYGYRNKEHLKTAIYFRCGNLQLYP